LDHAKEEILLFLRSKRSKRQ